LINRTWSLCNLVVFPLAAKLVSLTRITSG